jgi:6-phosphofructokinase 1
MKRIGIATTGGDAPGMNTAIRALTRLAQDNGIEVYGFEKGWEGMLHDQYQILTTRSVGGIIHQGGTILQTSRSDALRHEDSKAKIVEILQSHNIEGLIVLGGNGSFRASYVLSQEIDIPIIGIPATIDNDVYGSDETIGFDTAVNSAIEQIDKIRDTATSNDRLFITEVMGRDHGYIALHVGVSVGAEVILVPEIEVDVSEIIETIKANIEKGKKSGIIVMAEGVGDCRELADQIAEKTPVTVRINVLGYTQRGGSPTARSRVLATVFAREAIDLMLSGIGNRIVVHKDGDVSSIPLDQAGLKSKTMDSEFIELYKVLAS